MSETQPRVVIVGAGFGGLAAARALAGSGVKVLLLDRNNYHTFLPLLYEVAAAELDATEISHPVRSIVRKLPNVRSLMTEVSRVDLSSRTLETDGQPIRYDYLVLAMGSMEHYFGVVGAEEHAFPLYSLKQGLLLRNHVLTCLERATQEVDPNRRKELLTFAIVGGGPTGVEFAGALAELIHGPIMKDYPILSSEGIQIVLLEAMDRLLSSMPERLGHYAARRLGKMGVDIRLKAMVTQITPRDARLKNGQSIPTSTVVWTAGVRGDPQLGVWGLPTTRSGHIQVRPTLQVGDYPNVYAVGDLADLQQDGVRIPKVAPVAVKQGTTVGRNILRQIDGKEPEAYRYHNLGSTVAIGRNAGVVDFRGRTLTGFFAWLAWLGVHLLRLIGFRNRLFVLLDWAWDYFFFERSARLILPYDSRQQVAVGHEPPSRENQHHTSSEDHPPHTRKPAEDVHDLARA